MVLPPKTYQFCRSKQRVTKRYSSDLTDQEWQIIRSLLSPQAQGRGRKRQVDKREVLNGIFYQLHYGCIWSDMAKDLHAWQTYTTNSNSIDVGLLSTRCFNLLTLVCIIDLFDSVAISQWTQEETQLNQQRNYD